VAFDEKLAGRVRALLNGKQGLAEKRMFGGVAFLLRGKMCCGVLNKDLVARVGVEGYRKALQRPHVRPMNFTGRAIKGFVYVSPEGTRTKRGLQRWLDHCVAFVPSLTTRDS
jgi:TfoX/Sxy family transcriptional regulator of competence genes